MRRSPALVIAAPMRRFGVAFLFLLQH